jgi:hypothetical protein
MQGQGQQGQGYGTTTNVFTDWLDKAGPDEKIYAAKQTLAAIGELGTEHKDRFVQEVKTDPAITACSTS